jgi:hypothetical protein
MKTFTQNDSTYTSIEQVVRGKKYSFMTVEGKFNYVNITCIDSPFRSVGRQFDNWTEAAKAYKSKEMKLAILKVETGIA